MRQPKLAGVVRRRFIHCVNAHGQSVQDIVRTIGISPQDLCHIISSQHPTHQPLLTYHRIARWLHMPLANVLAIADVRPKLQDLTALGMLVRGYRPTSARDQIQAAGEAQVSVAVFRRALHGYSDFFPSVRTCDRLAVWLAWTGFEPDDIVSAAGMIVRYRADGRRVAVPPAVDQAIKPYPCACGRVGCMVPAHIPVGPRRKWRSDACRMWAKRRTQRHARVRSEHAHSRNQRQATHRYGSITSPIVRFIVINERPVPVRF